jgi:ABC-type transport system substrate-binding protein
LKGERKVQTRKVILSIAVILMLSVLTLPTYAWVYHDNPVDDGLYERFGPRADRLLISLYADDVAEFDALAAGDIDLTDWPLSKTRYDQFTGPLNDTIQVVSYGPEYGLFILDINSNNNEHLGNPPDELYPNPVYPNPTSNLGLRRAIAYLCNRDEYLADPSIGAGFGFPMYTTMPPAQAKYLLDLTEEPYATDMPWASTYSRAAANATLDAWGFAEKDVDGYRKWNVTGLTVNLKFYIRSDHPGRNMIGTKLLVELAAVGIKATSYFGNSPYCQGPVMAEKDFHLYTAGWSLGVNPDSLILWAWDYYWHPGKPYNYSGHNDPEFNDAANGIMYANTQEEAVTMAMTAQYRQALMVLSVPLYCVAGNKAYHKTYVGAETGEEAYTGKNWVGVKNLLGYGIDNGWSLMNMWPFQTEVVGNGAMTIRWGFKAPEIMEWNPIYSQWLFDWNAMNPLYESLLTRNPNDMGELISDVATDWNVSAYMNPDPALGECTKIRFTLRDDVYWSDGVQLGIGDIYFTFKELPDLLASRGLPPPWWQSNIVDIKSFSIIDPLTFEVLLGVKSYWALSWIGTNIILPQHIWRTIAETGNPQATAFDLTRMTGNGPWMAGSYGGIGSTVLHYKNPTFFNSGQVDAKVEAQGLIISPHKIKPCTPPTAAWFKVTVTSNWYDGPIHGTECHFLPLIVDKYIVFTNKTDDSATPIRTVTGITLLHGVPDVEIVTLADISAALGVTLPCWPKGSYDIDVYVHITGPPFVCDCDPPQPNPWICEWDNNSFDWWGTLRTDIRGLADYLPGVRMPDGIVDFRDIGEAARAFGAAVGTSRWNTIADINEDAFIDFRDINPIARDFGK